MSTTRKTFIKESMIYVVGSSLNFHTAHLFGQTNSLFSNVAGPEIDAFKKAQQRLLHKYNVQAKSRYVKLTKPKLRAHVLEVGKGAPVVMLHGGGAFACQFAPLMSALQKDFHLFVPDRPGCGLSDMINYSGVPFRQHAVDFVAGIIDNLKLNKVALIGNSMGGYWALLYALAYPERVTKLILIGEPAGSSPPGMQPPAPPADKNPSMEAIRGFYKYMLVANFEHIPKEILEAELAAAKIPGASVAWNTMIEQFTRNKDLGTYTLRTELKNLLPQTLFIWGAQDKFGQPKLGQEMAAIMPHATLVAVPDAGHLLWFDQPERCAQLTLDFLKS